MIVTIDGPAGAGKSTVAKKLAERLGFRFLDTGAMYRAAALAVHNSGTDPQNIESLVRVIQSIDIEWKDEKVYLDGRDVDKEIRSPEITQLSSIVAAIPAVRSIMVELQRGVAEQGNFVCEGRDQGTVVFPDAECKIFLTASPEVRGRRRWEQMQNKGAEQSLNVIIAEQKARDQRDENREVGRLLKAADAVEVVTDEMTLEQIIDELESIARSK